MTVSENNPENITTPVKKSLTYPVDALGTILGDAAKQLAYHVQTPIGIACQSVLAAASLIAQGHINVERGFIGVSPVSLFFLTIAESGDRKSSLDRFALLPVRNFEHKRLQEILEDKNAIAIERPNITFSEPTAEGIWQHYKQGKPSAGLFSDEGIGFFGGHGMNEDSKGRMISILSKLWDGDMITRTRGEIDESGILVNRRLSAHLMVQPVIAQTVLEDPLLQGQGILARFLICQEESIAGSRFLLNRDLTKGVFEDIAIKKYWERISFLLEKKQNINTKTGELELDISRLKGKSFKTWCFWHDEIEKELHQKFHAIKATASKAADNLARIAAILAFIEGYNHPNCEHVERAGKIIFYYLKSLIKKFNSKINDGKNIEIEKEAEQLLEWIKKNGGTLNSINFKTLPRHLRNAKKTRNLINYLVLNNQLIPDKTIGEKASFWKIK